MRTSQLPLLLVALVVTLCRADFLQYASQIPECGLSCLLQEIPKSACQTVTNSTCICTDPNLFTAVDSCMSSNCTVFDRLTVARVDEQACDKQKNHRTSDIAPLLFVDGFTFCILVIRIVARYWIIGSMEIDDWAVVVLFPFLIAFMVLGNYIRLTAIGYDVWDLEVDTITTALKLFFIDEIIYVVVLALARVCIVLFLMRVFAIPTFRRICWAVIGWVILSAVIIIFMTMFQCLPLSYNWEGWTGTAAPAKCLDVNALAFASAGMGISQDLTILFLPIPIIVGLNMALKKRLLTLFMFSLGIFVVLTSCLRLKYLVQFSKSLNPTWDYTDAVIWTSLEVKVTIIVLCLPTVRMLLARLIPSVFGTTEGSSNPKSSSAISGTGGRSKSDGTSSSNRRARYPQEEDEIELSVDMKTPPWGPTLEEGDPRMDGRTRVPAQRSKNVGWS